MDEENSLIRLIDEIFDIIKTDYLKYLSEEKRNFLENLNYKNLFEIKNDIIYYKKDGFSYPLKKEDLTIEVLIFMCLSSLCGKLTPFKICLIASEIKSLIERNNLEGNKNLDFELIKIIKEKILNDLPYNIIFLDTDIDIFNYLVTEKGIRTANIYYSLKHDFNNNFLTDDFNPLEYFLNYQDLEYETSYDIVYNFIENSVIYK